MDESKHSVNERKSGVDESKHSVNESKSGVNESKCQREQKQKKRTKQRELMRISSLCFAFRAIPP